VLTIAMRNRGLGRLTWCAALVLAACSDAELCDPSEIASALSSAGPGEHVRLGACEIDGPLRVPSGVTLEGTAGTVVIGPNDSAAIVLAGIDAVVKGLAVRAEGRIGIYAMPAASGEIRDATVEVTRGLGIAAVDAVELAIVNVTVTGEITSANATDSRWLRVAAAAPPAAACPTEPCDCTPGESRDDGSVCDSTGRWATLTSVYGIYLERTPAELSDVDVRGFASFGAVFRGAPVSWTDGSVSENLGTGIRAIAAELTLDGVAVTNTLEGLRGTPAYAIAATDDTVLTTSAVAVSDNERYGIVMIGGSAEHVDLVAERNDDVALWIADAVGVEVSGPATRFSSNAFAAIVIGSSDDVHVASGTLEGTRAAERVVGTFGTLRVGDGLHLLSGLTRATFETLAIRDNERAGVLLDLGAAAPPSFASVDVSGSGAALGAIAGTGDGRGALAPGAPAGWDSGITRDGITSANDASLTGTLDVLPEARPALPDNPLEAVGVVAPMF
jgi:hypothetical protein